MEFPTLLEVLPHMPTKYGSIVINRAQEITHTQLPTKAKNSFILLQFQLSFYHALYYCLRTVHF